MVYLKHTPSGDIFPYNTDLAKRGDMVQCTVSGEELPPTEVINDPSNAPVLKRRKTVHTEMASDLSV